MQLRGLDVPFQVLVNVIAVDGIDPYITAEGYYK